MGCSPIIDKSIVCVMPLTIVGLGCMPAGPMALGVGVGGEAEDVKQGGRGLHKMEEFGDD